MTLVGFSLGARVIFKCLQCLAESKGDNGNLASLPYDFHLYWKFILFLVLKSIAMLTSTAGLVERVVLLGAPISIKDENWEVARKVPKAFLNFFFKKKI